MMTYNSEIFQLQLCHVNRRIDGSQRDCAGTLHIIIEACDLRRILVKDSPCVVKPKVLQRETDGKQAPYPTSTWHPRGDEVSAMACFKHFYPRF